MSIYIDKIEALRGRGIFSRPLLHFYSRNDIINAVIGMYKKISQDEAKRIMDSSPNCIILDVRTEDEYVLGHIENSVCIPVDELDRRLDELPDKTAEILVCCRSGRSSALAAEYLDEKGYENVYDFGGLLSWNYGYVEWD